MEPITITIQETNNPTIIKFVTPHFLTNHESFEFNNIDEAGNSPLAQQLFYLPFVKKVYISSNFVAIERFNIVAWEDVQKEVADQIEKFINDGGTIVSSDAKAKKTAITVYAESTPNPSVQKYVTNKKLVPTHFEFTSIEEAKHSPLATELFHFPFVKSVFFDENYVSITKYDIAEWEDITMQLREFVRSFIEQGKVIVETTAPEAVKKTTEQLDANFESLDETSKQIVNILEEYIKPAVASDGGNIEFKSYNPDTKIVKVILQGACSGCPSSTFTLKNGIENMLKEMLKDQVSSVEAING